MGNIAINELFIAFTIISNVFFSLKTIKVFLYEFLMCEFVFLNKKLFKITPQSKEALIWTKYNLTPQKAESRKPTPTVPIKNNGPGLFVKQDNLIASEYEIFPFL